MRVWSLHPAYLDRQGLVACWRESLLAQAVLAGRTRGYRNHSQLVRFRTAADPVATIGAYLVVLAEEATERGYRFDAARIDRPARIGPGGVPQLPVTDGQVAHEWAHLLAKLAVRSPDRLATVRAVTGVDVHPLFVRVPGPVEHWERP
ncbi:pyrimidine dimer DNA glycosylase/endonuclease V [Georgenia sp. H159]|uniref:pyrimidine dimer DNA glycosylase/endonuclease V n=1 Tax=Georgenia sp. H159 TaxID=3076115 RepID=UPI002D794E87|nr:pyrimidine dimer DNA glycosylase/endonuclease V [Georgenia sp. H159]